jgi:ABC-type multidrug transport system fused ATPase/permease subunit
LFSGTIEENITYGVKDYSYEQLLEVCEKTGCMEFIGNPHLFPQGFKTTVGERGSQLSGGQRQRVSIARALLKKPKILIFDEATSALDSNSEFIVQTSIEKLVEDKSKKLTIIIIAHRLSTIINAERIFVMKQGEIIEEGSHNQLLEENGYYAELVEKQLQTKRIGSSKSLRLSSATEIP